MNARFIAIGSICALLSVAFGAFGAHMLKGVLSPDDLAVFQTGVQYHMTHSLGLIAVGLAAGWMPGSKNLTRAGWFLFAGILLFSGSLYVLSLSGIKILGAITPFGGVSFMIGWFLVALAALQHSKKQG
ncbi:DUF423 domain-containing protein [Paenibacillus piri]|uniref:DUF423 domain-containing protein n=1 Tax=Paenibacillus piri TaxID=2547395 RepID=A0A4R5KY26_9BACL|nr:DUF423 domain-containing protein [Paenibacillus piri]TDG00974.1 DUF423 domain-containing protein [Paenibacillus piri]